MWVVLCRFVVMRCLGRMTEREWIGEDVFSPLPSCSIIFYNNSLIISVGVAKLP